MVTVKIIDDAPLISNVKLDELENRLGFKLPEDLRRHYLQFNGGRPIPNLFPKDDEFFAVNEFLPIKYGAPGTRFEDTYEDLVQGNELFPKNLVPIASDSAGDYFCYSLEPEQFGAICFYQSDYYDDPLRAVVYLAINLETFLNSLVSDDGE